MLPGLKPMLTNRCHIQRTIDIKQVFLMIVFKHQKELLRKIYVI